MYIWIWNIILTKLPIRNKWKLLPRHGDTVISASRILKLFLLDVTMMTEEQVGSHVMAIKNCLETWAVCGFFSL